MHNFRINENKWNGWFHRFLWLLSFFIFVIPLLDTSKSIADQGVLFINSNAVDSLRTNIFVSLYNKFNQQAKLYQYWHTCNQIGIFVCACSTVHKNIKYKLFADLWSIQTQRIDIVIFVLFLFYWATNISCKIKARPIIKCVHGFGKVIYAHIWNEQMSLLIFFCSTLPKHLLQLIIYAKMARFSFCAGDNVKPNAKLLCVLCVNYFGRKMCLCKSDAWFCPSPTNLYK